jgi:hypothetical protein
MELSSRINQRHSHVTLSAKRRTTLSRGKGRGESQEVVKEELPDSVMSPTSNQGEEDAATVTTAASISNTDNTEIRTTALPANKGRQLSQRIQDDISDFERMGALREKNKVQEESDVTKTLKNVFSAVFIADFFVVIVFLIWFLAAAATQKSNPFLLEKFQVSTFVYELIAVQCLHCGDASFGQNLSTKEIIFYVFAVCPGYFPAGCGALADSVDGR